MATENKNIPNNTEFNDKDTDASEYPYRFSEGSDEYELVTGISVTEAKEIISIVDGPIVEIGGPSDGGYLYLDEVSLKSKPIITNIVPFSTLTMDQEKAKQFDQQIDAFFDGRDMPYEDNSLGIVAMSHITLADDSEFFPEGREPTQSEIDLVNQRFDRVDEEVEAFLTGAIDLDDVKESFRLKIYQEVMRVLKPGGLLISNGTAIDLQVLEKIGFKVISASSDDEGYNDFEFVAQKPQNG